MRDDQLSFPKTERILENLKQILLFLSSDLFSIYWRIFMLKEYNEIKIFVCCS